MRAESDPASLPVFAFSFNAMFAHQYTANGDSEHVQTQSYMELRDLLQLKFEPASYRLMLFAEVQYDEKTKKYLGVLRKKGHEPAYYDFDEFREKLGARSYELACYEFLPSGELKIFSVKEIDYAKFHLITDSQELADRLVEKQAARSSNMYLLQANCVALSDMERLEMLITRSSSPYAEIYLDLDATLVHGAEFTSFMTGQLVLIHGICCKKFTDLRYVIITARPDDSGYVSTQTYTTASDVCIELLGLTGCDIPPEDIIFTNGRFDKGEFVKKGSNFRLFFDDQRLCLESMKPKVDAAVQVHAWGFSAEVWNRLSRNLVPSAMELSTSPHSAFSTPTVAPISAEGENFVNLGDDAGSGVVAASQRIFTFYSGPKK